jgi:hypothetical protein
MLTFLIKKFFRFFTYSENTSSNSIDRNDEEGTILHWSDSVVPHGATTN